jgi:hypothetical protein
MAAKAERGDRQKPRDNQRASSSAEPPKPPRLLYAPLVVSTMAAVFMLVMVAQIFVGFSAHPDRLNTPTIAVLGALVFVCVGVCVFVVRLYGETQRRRRASLLIPPSSNLTRS